MRENVRPRWRKLSDAEKCPHLALGKSASSCSAYTVTAPHSAQPKPQQAPRACGKTVAVAPAFASGSGWPVPGLETSRSRKRHDRQLRKTQLSFLCDAFNIPQARPRSAGQRKSDLPVCSCRRVLRISALSVPTAGFVVPPDVHPTLRSLQVSAPSGHRGRPPPAPGVSEPRQKS